MKILTEEELEVGIKPGTVYSITEPKFVGKLPINQEIEVVENKNKENIGWSCKCYSGSEIYKLDENNKIIEIPLTNKDDLIKGLKIAVPNIFGTYNIMIAESKSSAKTESKEMGASLEFDKDDRHCWVSTCTMNLRGVRKTQIFTNEK